MVPKRVLSLAPLPSLTPPLQSSLAGLRPLRPPPSAPHSALSLAPLLTPLHHSLSILRQLYRHTWHSRYNERWGNTRRDGDHTLFGHCPGEDEDGYDGAADFTEEVWANASVLWGQLNVHGAGAPLPDPRCNIGANVVNDGPHLPACGGRVRLKFKELGGLHAGEGQKDGDGGGSYVVWIGYNRETKKGLVKKNTFPLDEPFKPGGWALGAAFEGRGGQGAPRPPVVIGKCPVCRTPVTSIIRVYRP